MVALRQPTSLELGAPRHCEATALGETVGAPFAPARRNFCCPLCSSCLTWMAGRRCIASQHFETCQLRRVGAAKLNAQHSMRQCTLGAREGIVCMHERVSE